ncbi:ApeA N-terminal domain 1-containing protein [Arthrobacter sp. P2b]|uniref:ApeA N-terminal domain 1-containing protein n=1 Tax=Arthrobacter sp. P2b TaxID=1938741 RepID=UPI0034C6C715
MYETRAEKRERGNGWPVEPRRGRRNGAEIWWLPDAPGDQIPGVLRYEPDNGLTVSMIGAFEDRIMSETPGCHHAP